MNLMRGAIALLIGLALTAGPSAADERDHRRGFERGRHEGWRGDIHHFHEHDLGRWRAGHWFQGHHFGRFGWWWIVGGVWYYYPAPVYPYPNPFQPPLALVPPAPATQYWYYCPNPPGYYPYVARCGSHWQRVPANPPLVMPR